MIARLQAVSSRPRNECDFILMSISRRWGLLEGDLAKERREILAVSDCDVAKVTGVLQPSSSSTCSLFFANKGWSAGNHPWLACVGLAKTLEVGDGQNA